MAVQRDRSRDTITATGRRCRASNDDPFRNRVAVVTGASRGIGRATALALARRGALTVPLARSADQLRELEAEIEQGGGRARAVIADVTNDTGLRSALAGVARDLGPVEILVANAGIGCRGEIIDLDPGDLRQVFDVNFFGVVSSVQAVLPGMLKRRSGSIVLVSSVAGKRAFPQAGGYAASKWALQALAESLRHEVWGSGVHVATVCPGPVVTGFQRSLVGRAAAAEPRWRPFALTADQTADVILEVIEHRKREVVVSWPYRLALPLLAITWPYLSPFLQVALRVRRRREAGAPDR